MFTNIAMRIFFSQTVKCYETTAANKLVSKVIQIWKQQSFHKLLESFWIQDILSYIHSKIDRITCDDFKVSSKLSFR